MWSFCLLLGKNMVLEIRGNTHKWNISLQLFSPYVQTKNPHFIINNIKINIVTHVFTAVIYIYIYGTTVVKEPCFLFWSLWRRLKDKTLRVLISNCALKFHFLMAVNSVQTICFSGHAHSFTLTHIIWNSVLKLFL